MNMTIKRALFASTVAVAIGAAETTSAACLTNPSDVVGSPVFGATVSTFIGLGVNPSVTCIENALWANPSSFLLGTYVKGADGVGFGVDNLTLGSYSLGGSVAGSANALDHAWVQDVGNQTNPNGAIGGAPSSGIVWDLGGQANQVAVFVFVDHGPVPGEVLENTAWLSNDPNADDAAWTQAALVHV